MDAERTLHDFDPDGVGNTSNNIFRLPFSTAESKVIFIPVPWDVTVSNHEGTCEGPSAIFENSFQIDLHDPAAPEAWKEGMAMEAIDQDMIGKNNILRKQARQIIKFQENGGDIQADTTIQKRLTEVNQATRALHADIEMRCLKYLENGQLPVLVGGDHSTPTGLIRALATRERFGILQIDAHADLRNAYQGFADSHASVMYNALQMDNLEQLVQVGIRELSGEENRVITQHPGQISTWYDHDLHRRLFEGTTWGALCREIVQKLPGNVYISFDVDGLEPSHCPGTGTPVPGGLTFMQAMYLLETVMKEGKRIIGADLSETGPSTLDGIISSRILFRMAGMMIHSNQ
ncbi:MAG: arginase family protein [Bacteroidota bacterium]